MKPSSARGSRRSPSARRSSGSRRPSRSRAPGRPPTEIGLRAAECPEVIECNRVTGAESHVIRAWCRDLAHLNDLIEIFTEYGETITNVVTDTPVKRRAISFE